MSIPNSNVIQGGFKASFGSTSYVELHLVQVHGDLHEIIPPMLSAGKTQQEIAQALSTKDYVVTQSWLSKWLKRNDYRSVTRWVRRPSGGES